MYPLAENRAGAGDDRRLHHAGVLDQQALHLRRVHLVSSPVDHVLAAIQHLDVAIGIDSADIAGPPAAVAERIPVDSRKIPVARDYHWTSDPEFTHAARRQFPAFVVANADLRTMHREPDAVAAAHRVGGRQQRCRGGGLGGSVRVHQLQTRKPAVDLLYQRGRHGGPSVGADAKMGERGRVQSAGTQHQVVHRGHHDGVGHAFIAEQADGSICLEFPLHDDRACTGEHGQYLGDETRNVGERDRQKRAFDLVAEAHCADVVEHAVRKVEMGDHGALGAAGGA